MTETKNYLVCVGAPTLAILLAWPFVDFPFGDDVAYSHMALMLSQTGRLAFNGWEAAMMVQQAYWGALFIKLFGFSFLAMRLSTVPLALGSILLCYWLVRRIGLQPSHAVLATLLLALDPVFLPAAVSYLTDVPGLFFLLASLNALVLAAETSGSWRGYVWLVVGIFAGLLGGTGRQFVWFVPLFVLPYLAWVRRRDNHFAIASLAGWIVSVASVAATNAWFNHQPYVVPLPSMTSALRVALKHPVYEGETSARIVLMLLLLCLPVALPLAARSWKDTWNNGRARKIVVCALLLLVAAAILVHPSLASIPWMYSTLDWQGISGDGPLPGRPIVLTRPIRVVYAVLVYVTACILIGELFRVSQLVKHAWKTFRDPNRNQFPLMSMAMISAIYFVTVVIRAAEFSPFDRYLLPLIPIAATLCLLPLQNDNRGQQTLSRRTMPLAYCVLIVFGIYAALSTQDYWSLAGARLAAAKKLEAAGVPRTAIDAGMEYNYWTQLMIGGQLNWRFVKNPPGAYQPQFGITPDVKPIYRLDYVPIPGETEATHFGSVPYFSLLPPFHKQVSIDRIVVPGNTTKDR